MKKFLFKLLGRKAALDLILAKEVSIDPKVPPTKVMQEISTGSLENFVQSINQKEAVPLLTLRKLTIVHYICMHYPNMCELMQQIDLKACTSDLWLNENVIKPYCAFLYKIINSGGFYSECKSKGVLDISLRMLFYTTNTLNELFVCVRKISSLHRYYSKEEKILGTSANSDFVLTVAYEAQEIYNCFKAILGSMIALPDKYLQSQSDKMMIKYIVEEVLPKINEEMKNLFLDKYFFPYGKGFGVKLFKEEDLTGNNREFMDSLSQQAYEKRPKRNKKMSLDRILFDEKGRLNPQTYATLSQIRLGDVSLKQLKIGHAKSMTDKMFSSLEIEQVTEQI